MATVGGHGARTIRELFGPPGAHTLHDWGAPTTMPHTRFTATRRSTLHTARRTSLHATRGASS